MKVTKTLVALSTLFVIGIANAQTFIPAPFVPTIGETFNAIPVGAYTNFVGFGGVGLFSRIGTGGMLAVNNNPAILPPISGNDMFGRGVNVRIQLKQVRKRWGGHFRVANAGIAVTAMSVRFFKAGLPVGVAVSAPINNAAWQWRGWDLSAVGGYDEVRVYGNVPAAPGYVGMENIRVQ